MNVIPTAIPEVKIIVPKIFGDARGFFFEGFQKDRYAALGWNNPVVQLNHSRSHYGVLRGLHYQREHPQDKLVTVIRGKVFDVAVDIRYDSPYFGRWVGFELSDENHYQMLVPKGFAHGFVVLSEVVDFIYACTDYYHPASEYGVLWSDPALSIPWNVAAPTLSDKDKAYPCLKDIPPAELPRMIV